ncbi:hypothetical protein AOLI_G00004560 [Acnodon oligacanthus]
MGVAAPSDWIQDGRRQRGTGSLRGGFSRFEPGGPDSVTRSGSPAPTPVTHGRRQRGCGLCGGAAAV